MARATTQKAAKNQGPCRVCGHDIEQGRTYMKWAFRFRGALKIHEDCRPGVRRSWLTGSEILGTLWDLVDDYAPEGGTPAEIAESLRGFADEVRSVMVDGLYQEKLDNMEGAGTGLENTPVYQELEERRDNLECWCSDMESIADEIDEEQEAWDAWQALQEKKSEEVKTMECVGTLFGLPVYENPDMDDDGPDEPDLDALIEQAQDAVNDCPE